MVDRLQELRDEVRLAMDVLAQHYFSRLDVEPGFDPDGFFLYLRRTVEARATTLKSVRREGPMGGGGPNEA